MAKQNFYSRLLVTTVLSTGVFFSHAFAQDDSAQHQVTGSRLLQSDADTSPFVTKIDGAEFRSLGFLRSEDLLNTLPQVTPSQSSEINLQATGTAQVDLRGLGADRTLVLVDGRRLPFGSFQAPAANLDFVPVQLIERMDVTSQGGSAVYGSGAMAGVVNFIMRRDFEGIEFDGQAGFFQDGNDDDFANAVLSANGITGPSSVADGRNVGASILMGANTADGRGNVTAFFSYQDQNEIRAGQRDHAICGYSPGVPPPNSVGGIACPLSGSFRRFFTSGLGVTIGDGDLFLSDNGTFVPFTGSPEQSFNFTADTFLQRPVERFHMAAFSRYALTDNVEAYLDFSFLDNTTMAQIAPTGAFTSSYLVNCDNPFLTAPVSTGGSFRDSLGCSSADIAAGNDAFFLLGYRNVEGAPSQTVFDNTTWRLVGGFRGNLGENWQWDAYGQFSRVQERRLVRNRFVTARLQDALFAVSNGTGGVVCRSGNAGCAPYNVFQRPGGQSQVSQAALNYIQGDASANGDVEQKIVGATLRGDLEGDGFISPFADRGMQLVAGVEWREDQLSSRPDDQLTFGAPRTFTETLSGIDAFAGELRALDLFMETEIPLVTGRQFIEALSIGGAYRYSDYSGESENTRNGFDAHSFNAEANWSISPDIHLYGRFQRSHRAPNIVDFPADGFSIPVATNVFTSRFFCSGLNVPGAPKVAQCQYAGLLREQDLGSTLFTLPESSLLEIDQPFDDLEMSDTYSVGIDFSPTFLPGVSLSAEFFDVSINTEYQGSVIEKLSPDGALSQCFNTGDPQFCDLFTVGFGGFILLTDLSEFDETIGGGVLRTSQRSRGIDFNLSYNHQLNGWGAVTANFAATYFIRRSVDETLDIDLISPEEPVPSPCPGNFLSCDGFFTGENDPFFATCNGLYGGGCANVFPRFRHRLVTTWQTPWNVDVSAVWRRQSSVALDAGQSVGGTSIAPSGNVLDDRLDAGNYLDLAAGWAVRKNASLRVGVQNVLGSDPALTTRATGALGNGNTFPGNYDPLGRYFYFGVTLSI